VKGEKKKRPKSKVEERGGSWSEFFAKKSSGWTRERENHQRVSKRKKYAAFISRKSG